METRMEKNKVNRKFRRKKRLKRFMVFSILVLTIIGLYTVNREIQRKNFLENSNLFKIEIEDKVINFLGKKYYVDFDFINEYLPIG